MITTPNDPRADAASTYETFHQAPIAKTVFLLKITLPPGTITPPPCSRPTARIGESSLAVTGGHRGKQEPWDKKAVDQIYLYLPQDLGGGQWVIGFEWQELYARR